MAPTDGMPQCTGPPTLATPMDVRSGCRRLRWKSHAIRSVPVLHGGSSGRAVAGAPEQARHVGMPSRVPPQPHAAVLLQRPARYDGVLRVRRHCQHRIAVPVSCVARCRPPRNALHDLRETLWSLSAQSHLALQLVTFPPATSLAPCYRVRGQNWEETVGIEGPHILKSGLVRS